MIKTGLLVFLLSSFYTFSEKRERKNTLAKYQDCQVAACRLQRAPCVCVCVWVCVCVCVCVCVSGDAWLVSVLRLRDVCSALSILKARVDWLGLKDPYGVILPSAISRYAKICLSHLR